MSTDRGEDGFEAGAAPGTPATSGAIPGIELRDESIRLGQFLKLASLVESGANAKDLIAEGHVQVNGERCTQRGKQLRHGDVVALGGVAVRVVGAGEDQGQSG